MAHIQQNPLIRVVETSAVDYKKKSFLFFSWKVKVSSTKLRKDIVIQTNDEFDSVFINGKEYKLTNTK